MLMKPRKTSTLDVSKLRKRLNMTQEEFCQMFGCAMITLSKWEEKKAKPRRSSKILLALIDADPSLALKVAKEVNRGGY